MVQIQNLKKESCPSLTNPDLFKKFIENLNRIYYAPEMRLTHPSQIYRTRIRLITCARARNGNIYFQGSPKILEKYFNTETEQIIKLAKNLENYENQILDV